MTDEEPRYPESEVIAAVKGVLNIPGLAVAVVARLRKYGPDNPPPCPGCKTPLSTGSNGAHKVWVCDGDCPRGVVTTREVGVDP